MYSNNTYNRWRRHPWHGLYARTEGAPDDVVQVYVEMTPSDVVKYELDKNSGFLMVDRPQRTTSSPPACTVSFPALTAPRKWPPAATTPTLQTAIPSIFVCIQSA